MRKRFKKIIFFLFGCLVAIQFYQPARNISNEQALAADINTFYNIPPNIQTILRTSCYDCHSNNTSYPWYSYIQPTRMLMESHIKNGKENLNFNEWATYSKRKQENKLDRIIKQIQENEMPLPSYLLMHKNAKLNNQQKQTIINWINSLTINKIN